MHNGPRPAVEGVRDSMGAITVLDSEPGRTFRALGIH